jgi:hypothetical protein
MSSSAAHSAPDSRSAASGPEYRLVSAELGMVQCWRIPQGTLRPCSFVAPTPSSRVVFPVLTSMALSACPALLGTRITESLCPRCSPNRTRRTLCWNGSGGRDSYPGGHCVAWWRRGEVRSLVFALGATKSLITIRSWWSTGLEMTAIGAHRRCRNIRHRSRPGTDRRWPLKHFPPPRS